MAISNFSPAIDQISCFLESFPGVLRESSMRSVALLHKTEHFCLVLLENIQLVYFDAKPQKLSCEAYEWSSQMQCLGEKDWSIRAMAQVKLNTCREILPELVRRVGWTAEEWILRSYLQDLSTPRNLRWTLIFDQTCFSNVVGTTGHFHITLYNKIVLETLFRINKTPSPHIDYLKLNSQIFLDTTGLP